MGYVNDLIYMKSKIDGAMQQESIMGKTDGIVGAFGSLSAVIDVALSVFRNGPTSVIQSGVGRAQILAGITAATAALGHVADFKIDKAALSTTMAIKEITGGLYLTTKNPDFLRLSLIALGLLEGMQHLEEPLNENSEVFGKFLWELHNNPENNDLSWWEKGLIGWGGLLSHLVGAYDKEGRNKYYTVVYDPLPLDLNGDGKLSTVGTDGGINFDFNGDRLAGNTGWVGKDDGLLVFDANQDGNVTNGSELFGDNFIIGLNTSYQKVENGPTSLYALN